MSNDITIEIDYLAPELRQHHFMDVAGVIAGHHASMIEIDHENIAGGFQVDHLQPRETELDDFKRQIDALDCGIRITTLQIT